MFKLYTMFFKLAPKYHTEDSLPIPFTSKRLYFQWYKIMVVDFELVRMNKVFTLVLYRLNNVYIANPATDIF